MVLSILLLIFCTCFALAAWPQARSLDKHKIIPINDPHAGTASGQGTWPWSLNSAMDVVGWYFDSNGVWHGFLRDYKTGKFTTIDDPHAGTASGQGTACDHINDNGEIVGSYIDSNGVVHGYLRHPDGKYKEIDVKNAGTGPGQGNNAAAMNSEGWIGGTYADTNTVYHGFLINPKSHKLTEFQCHHAGNGAGQGWNMNAGQNLPKEQAAASCIDSNNVSHGSVRHTDGKVEDFDVKGPGKGSGEGTFALDIDAAGVIAGHYCDARTCHGYVRDPNGKITKIAVKGAQVGTWAWSINSEGVIDGTYCAAIDRCQHGYLRAPDGTITKYAVRGACCGSAAGLGFTRINEEGAIAGNYTDNNNVNHGFLRMP